MPASLRASNAAPAAPPAAPGPSAHPTLAALPTAPRPALAAPPGTPRDAAATELRAALVALLPQLRARALRLCGDRATADDVVQDTFERTLRFAAQYEKGTNLRAWVFQVLFSVFVTRWRRQRRERTALRDLAADPQAWTVPAAPVAPDAGAGALTRTTMRKLRALPAGFRAAVMLVDLEQRTYDDAARELGIPVGTVMSRLHRGRKLLAATMVEPAAA